MKKAAARIACLLLAVLMLGGCGSQAVSDTVPTAPESSGAVLEHLEQIHALGESPDDLYRTFYEVFVYSFCDSDGDGIGDLRGLTSKLDYLQELGINGIWMMPIHPSTSYHKYNVGDYYAIDPAYGTLEDFDAFMAECQARDIHVILDLVVNHTGDDHPWFTQAVDYLKTLEDGEPDPEVCPYVDYYFFSREEKPGYRSIAGTSWYYEGQFDTSMPDLNLGSQALRQEIRDIMAFWFDRGVSGFRLDAAKEFYSGAVQKNLEVLSWIQTTALELNPEAYLVAEVWEGFAAISQYYASGITSLFDFAYGDSNGKIITTLRGAGTENTVTGYAQYLQRTDEAYLASNPDYIDAPFLSNHDVGRTAGFLSRDPDKTKLAGAMNLFMSGCAFIYYGEEIGMVSGGSNDPSKRAPMYWNPEGDNGTTQPPPECTLPQEYPFGSLAEQQGDAYSVYNYYRRAVAIRQAIPAISHGRTTAEEALNLGCVSAQRKTWGEESCIILMNIQAQEAQVDLTGYEGWTLAATLTTGEAPVDQGEGTLTMPPWAVAVLIPQ